VLHSAADRLRRIAEMVAIPWWGDRLSATISAGAVPGGPGETAEDLLAKAEAALQLCRERRGEQAARQ